MVTSPSPLPMVASGLAAAIIDSSRSPLLLMAEDLSIISASASFCNAFGIDPKAVTGATLASLGHGEWAIPQLESLLRATFAGAAAIDSYEMKLERKGKPTACLVLHAHMLDYCEGEARRVVLAVADITSARIAERLKDDLLRENQMLLQELQHRVANSLQIIASVLLQSARKVQSEETRLHLHDAHNRVMSIATLQRQLAVKSTDSVALGQYLTELCASISASMIDDQERVSLTSTADGSVTSANVSASLGLIVTELVINSLKHAFQGQKQTGKIQVNYQANGDGWTMTVDDNGNGMTAEADTTPGLGTGIVEALAKQLQATVQVTDGKPGTKVTISHVT